MLHDVARTSGVGSAGRLFRVTLPAALPSIATGHPRERHDRPARLRDRRVPHGRRRHRRTTWSTSSSQTRSRSCTPRSSLSSSSASAVNAPAAGRAAPRALLGRRGAVGAVTASDARRLAGPALGVLVFLAALGIWQLWAGAADSFLVPTAGEVAQRAWHVWPTSDFLSQVGQSMKRYAVGFAIAAAIGIGLGLLVGSSHAARRTLEPFLELMRAVPAIALVPGGDPRPRPRRRVPHRDHRLRPLLSDPREHRRRACRPSRPR